MNVVGIIAEYNPFHNGHAYHLAQARQLSNAEYVICAMSGSFMQRGDVAIADKWTRAALAVNAGVDLAIELPTVFALRSAENFARGGVALLNSLGIVTHLAFGAETADLPLLQKIAITVNSPDFSLVLRSNLKQGLSYPAALQRSLKLYFADLADLLGQPNNILAIEYLKSLDIMKSSIIPIPIKRYAANHHDVEIVRHIASATAIRQELKNPSALSLKNLSNSLPPASLDALVNLSQSGLADIKYLSTALLAKLRCLPPADLAKIAGIGEGLENKIIAAALSATSMAELQAKIKSKRYPMSRIKRALLHCLLNCTKADIAEFDQAGPLYCRILAFNDRGRELLKRLKAAAAVPIITKPAQYLNSQYRYNNLAAREKMLAYDTFATDLYKLCFADNRPGGDDFTKSPIYIKNNDKPKQCEF